MALDTMVPIPVAGSDALTAPEARGLACYVLVAPAGHAYYMLFCMELLVRRVVLTKKFRVILG